MDQKTRTRLTRRAFLRAAAIGAGSAALAACGGGGATTAPTAPPATLPPPTAAPTLAPVQPTPPPTAAPAATAAPAGAVTNSLGVTLPSNAAPLEHQAFVVYFDITADFTSPNQMETIYKSGGFGSITNLTGDTLVRLNKDFQVQPAAALSWSSDETGKVWTFNLDPNLVWSDGTPVTADDFVATFRYAADPQHAWDFAWYYSAPGAIKNWDKCVAGELPLEELGVTAKDKHTLIIETETPAPFLPAKLVYSEVLSAAKLKEFGTGLYTADPAKTISCGPYLLKEFKPGERVVFEINPTYKGTNRPRIERVIQIAARPEAMFAGYQAGEVDRVTGEQLQTADNEIIARDPELSKQVRLTAADFRTDYLFFDCQNPPFNDVRVRQAFSHIIDRDTLIKTIITPTQGIPAYSFLMPGFPASNSEGLKDIQRYDPERGRALLKEAGYEGGKGFPKLTMWLRNEPQIRQALAAAIAAEITQEYGIEVEVSNKEFKTFMDAINAKPTQIQFGMVSYGIDFLDPSNMLGVWLSTGRHNWFNKTFDEMVLKAAEMTDQEERIKIFQDAERLLCEEAPAVFIYHRTVADIYKPYVVGECFEPNIAGFAGLQWPGFTSMSDSLQTLYISDEVTKYRKGTPR
ncbi:peptide ABC transporter substrate-binding protein [Roseiflexus sp.]|uniref:peptide ABC transporter substrate-binding protein n=1 Tax=Roseiflexus sp. TaxID=2562120 RepID=UPI00398BABEC